MGRPSARPRAATTAPRSQRHALLRTIADATCPRHRVATIMAKNIYVGNLPYETTADDLLELFSTYGAVSNSQVIIDKFSGRSRGFGFVEMANDSEAQAAIDALSGTPFGDRPLTVNEARPREDRGGGARRGGRGGYGGGSFGS